MVPAAMPASRATSETRELQYPFRANTRTAASTICCGLSGSRMTEAESPFILWAAAMGVKRKPRSLDVPRARAYDPARGDQVPHRHHARPVAARARLGRLPVGALRVPR